MNPLQHRDIAILQLLLCLILFMQLNELSLLAAPLKGGASAFPAFHAPELTDEQIKEEIRVLVDELYIQDKGFFDGIRKILVVREDINFLQNASGCEGHILGAIGKDTILIKESGNTTNRRTLAHEIGHNLWRKLSEQQKEEWNKLHRSTEVVSLYAMMSPEEDFAESFSCVMTAFENCRERLTSEKRTFIEAAISQH